MTELSPQVRKEINELLDRAFGNEAKQITQPQQFNELINNIISQLGLEMSREIIATVVSIVCGYVAYRIIKDIFR